MSRVNHVDGAAAPRRYEQKYVLPLDYEAEIRGRIAPYVCPDPHCIGRPASRYTVRSIYFDTADLRFYFEKIDGLKVRRKLRLRSYDRCGDRRPAYLEIKRKIGRAGYKERVQVPLDRVEAALNGLPAAEVLPDAPLIDQRVLERFRFNVLAVHLEPVILVAYEREAYVGRDDERARATFDLGLRSLWRPKLSQLYDERYLRRFNPESMVLELKFNNRMPRWMARLVSDLNLRKQAYSKFCEGIEAWEPELRLAREPV